jgi:hypothetical protein
VVRIEDGMTKSTMWLAVGCALLLLSGCGRVREVNSMPLQQGLVVKAVELKPATISSLEDNADADAYDRELKALAQQELAKVLKARSIQLAAGAPFIVDTRIDVIYGKRALRLFFGMFGAGSGKATVDVTLRDRRSGQVVYATHGEGTLRRGVFIGSDMMVVARKTVQQAAVEFGAKLDTR